MRVRGYAYVVIALASAAAYTGWAAWQGAVGFALDDAWIHQVYARNLAWRGEFAFTPGIPSAGSTSPLWTLSLVPAFWLRIDPRLWTILLGAIFLGLAGALAARLAGRLFVHSPVSRPSLVAALVGLAVVLEWHLAWGSVSGMEIPLFVFLSLLLLERFYASEKPWLLGLIAGLLFLTRPEGVVLAGLVGAGLALRMRGIDSASRRSNVLGIMAFAATFVVVLVPYSTYNIQASGTLFPNTFYAKNAEYAIIAERVPYLQRFLQLFFVPWVGVGVLLAPGVIFIALNLAARKHGLALLPLVWVAALPALYAWRLPVAYQHGRYEIPVIPIIVLYGVWGTAALLRHIPIRTIRPALVLSAAAVLVAFWFLGVNAYANDVAVIDCEMVQSAAWASSNIPAGSLIAAHDIGALGYLNDRPLIDLAGLISPEVIPIIRDEPRLRDYLLTRRADYVVFFPDWYPRLAQDSRFVPVKRMDCPVARGQGGTDMVIYRINHD